MFRACMTPGLVALVLGTVLLANPAAAKTSSKISSKLLGKAFFAAERIKDVAPEALAQLFEKPPAKIEISRAKNKNWPMTLVAFFKKPSFPGPITLWIYDKAEKESLKAKEPIHAISVDSQPKEIFVYDLQLDPDNGFNKGHTYLVQVGQIVGKKEKVYATGEVSLRK